MQLENQGSTARDHLANERTFLAWVRTGLGIAGLGVALEKLGAEASGPPWTGLVLVGFGVAMLVYAMVRFERVKDELLEGRFPVARRGPLLIGALALMLSAIAFALLLVE
jgi:putative membrane protein